MSESDRSSLLAAAFEHAPFGLIVVDELGNPLLGNTEYASMVGRRLDEVTNLHIASLARKGEIRFTSRVFAELVNGERDRFQTDLALQLADGSERVHHLSVWRVPLGADGAAVAGVLTPLPKRAGLDDARILKLLDNIDTMVWLFDRDGSVIETQGRFRATIGYPPEFWATRTVFDVLVPESVAHVLETREGLLSNPGQPFEIDVNVVGADGSVHVIHAHAVNLLDDPDIAGVLVTTRNVTEERALASELANRTRTAEREASLRTRLVANVSHELRNPLHAMGGLSELLANTDLPEDSAVLAATLHRQVTALTAVLDDLLDSSRLDGAPVSLRTNDVVLRPMIDDVVSILSSVVSNRPLTIKATVDPAVPDRIRSDGPRLRQVLSNLMGNAVKFTERGVVELTVDVTEDERLQFVVRDTGRGIAADELDSIFEPFTSATNGGEACGAGLGLTIVLQLVTAMRGRIAVESTLGAGTTFTVVVPFEPALGDEVASRTTAAPPPTTLSSSTVLVVEDTEVNQILAGNQLRRLGVECVIVGSGEEALKVMDASPTPRIVLMDFQLPGIDGLETTRRIRALDTTKDVVIIGVTASAMAADRAACRDAGMDDFLAKPVGLDRLREMLERWTTKDVVAELAGDTTALRGTSLDTLTTLADELGDASIVDSLVGTYLSELSTRSIDIQDAAKENDLHRVQRKAHALKSTSLMLGLTDLGRLCRDLEALDHADGLPHLMAALPNATLSAEQDLRRWLERTPSLAG